MTNLLSGSTIFLVAIGTIFTGGVFHFGLAPTPASLTTTAHYLNKKHHHRRHHYESKIDSELASYTKEAQADFIRDLPGLDYGDPGFKQFSGYLTVSPDSGRNLFYWYVESQDNPDKDPVVLWSNGGPGCSGLIGFGTEHGPFYIRANGTLTPNPYSWNKIASILYIEQPAGVGFSYSDTEGDYKTGDEPAAKDNYRFIREFLKRFPERQENPFYISSESYGGHYMPQLTMEIINQNTDGLINFQGMMVGNPYVDPFSNTVTQVRAFYSHGLLPKPLYDEWSETCTALNTFSTKKCETKLEEMFQSLYGNINPYALDYPICMEEKAAISSSNKHSRHLQTDTSSQAQQLMKSSTAGGPPFLPTEDVYRPCSEEHLDAYLNRKDVREAIHVSPKAKKWDACSSIVNYSKADFEASIIDLYRTVLQKAVEHGFQVFVFSGDDDSVCSTTGTQTWIYDLGFAPQAAHLWKPWKVNNVVAGYKTNFELRTDSGAEFIFATVHGAGHEVPAYRPMESLEMFRKVLTKEW